jgi:hypothetical protein
MAAEAQEQINVLQNISAFDFGWIAGMIEGEGCFYQKGSCSKLTTGTYCYPLAGFALMSTDEDIMQKLANLLQIELKGPYYKTSKKKRKVVWSIQATGQKAKIIMSTFRSYLGKRRQQQIDSAFEWQNRGKFRLNKDVFSK